MGLRSHLEDLRSFKLGLDQRSLNLQEAKKLRRVR
jgi:hypothetical protein